MQQSEVHCDPPKSKYDQYKYYFEHGIPEKFITDDSLHGFHLPQFFQFKGVLEIPTALQTFFELDEKEVSTFKCLSFKNVVSIASFCNYFTKDGSQEIPSFQHDIKAHLITIFRHEINLNVKSVLTKELILKKDITTSLQFYSKEKEDRMSPLNKMKTENNRKIDKVKKLIPIIVQIIITRRY
jgi:hypothetical protein